MAKKKKKAAKAAREQLIIASKVKAYVRDHKMMTASDAIVALSDQIYDILDKAIERAQANRRTTVRPQDL